VNKTVTDFLGEGVYIPIYPRCYAHGRGTRAPGCGDRRVWVRGPGWPDHLCQVIAAYALRLNSRAGTEGLTVSYLNCDRWLILGL